jgi:E3 ubiquitin-protein ligase HERC2
MLWTQQMRFLILKAAQVLLTQQDNLRKILLQSSVELPVEGSLESSTGSLLQQLMQTATQPSPLKAMFHRNEMEVCWPWLHQVLISYFV